MGNQKNLNKQAGTSGEEIHPTIVLVHGAFVDASGWEAVYNKLKKNGYKVAIVQNPTISLEGDVAATKRVIDTVEEPVILVGHSYGGAVITEAGNDPKVAGLVYIDAFALDKGESVSALIKDPVPGAPAPPLLAPLDGFILLDKEKFPEAFAADVDPDKARFMADTQIPWGIDAVNGTISEPAWKNKPSWYLIGTKDRMVPPDAQRFMANRSRATIVEAEGSHSIYVSKPDIVTSIIETAAKAIAEETLIK
ncbi:alpha/beta hydrolase [Sporocytophaga myxococcoides]|uniref:alpha/beta hydrolase n=1 Tax=Sporocytophaga myxococcoides TaxID=153721 RepID=UPI00041A4125|nr:alpha/beta hydrolase [Sporocytophaga myxococcoides]